MAWKPIEAYFDERVVPEAAMLLLDEVQSAPEILAKLRWFSEEMSELPVVAAGSLLDFALADHTFSMPVGRISYLYLEPMAFSEFLTATGSEQLRRFIEKISLTEGIPESIHLKLLDRFRDYMLIGGGSGAAHVGTSVQGCPALLLGARAEGLRSGA